MRDTPQTINEVCSADYISGPKANLSKHCWWEASGLNKAPARLEGWAQQVCAMGQGSYTRTSNAGESLDPLLAALPITLRLVFVLIVRKGAKTQSPLIPKPLLL